MIKSYPNRTYRLKDYKSVVNESRIKLFHSVDERLSDDEGLDITQGMSYQSVTDINKLSDDIPSTGIIDGDDATSHDGAHDSGIDEPSTVTVEKTTHKRKNIVFENSGTLKG